MPPTDFELDRLAELLTPAGILVRPHAAAIGLAAAPPTDELAAWRAWFAALSDAQLVALLGRLGPNPLVVAIAAALATAIGPRAAIGDEAPHILLKGMPIVDRIEVWTKLPALMDGAQRILQIRGAAKVGKSYLRYLIHEFCNSRGPGHDVRYFDLDGAKSLAYIAGDIIAQLRPPITLRARDLAHSTDRAWASSTAREVYEALRHAEPPLTRWLVFDHFDRARSDDAIVFFAVLAEQVALAASDPNVTHGPRLVLIDHGVPLPDVARPVAAEVVVSRVTVPDLEQFGRRCRPTWTAADARRLFEDVRAAADAAIDDLQREAPGVSVGDPFMDMLCKRLHALLRPEPGPTPEPTPEPTR